MTSRHLHRLLRLAFVLALIIVGASATLRLSANGIGCSPWPACYGQAATAAAAQDSLLVQTLRLAHRLSASSFALVALLAVVLGWRRWRAGARGAAVALLLVTALLAGIGRFTPSALPLITLINVLGGLSLLLLLAWLLAASTEAPSLEANAPTSAAWRRFARNAAIVLLLALAWQAASGALISVRLAGAACSQGCDQFWLPGHIALLDPLRTGSARELLVHAATGQPLHLIHRLFGLATLIVAWAVVMSWPGRHSRWPRATAWALTAGLLTGVVAASFDGTLSAVVAHALLAGLAVAGVGVMLGARGGEAGG